MRRLAACILMALLLLVTASMLFAQESSPPPTGAPPSGAPVPPAVQPTSPRPAGPPAEYKLQKDDIINIQVWGEPNFSGEVAIDPQGYVVVPHLKPILAAGLTQPELVEKIREGLTEYLADPKVQVTITQYHKPKVYVLGQVFRPGLQEFIPGDRVMEAIAQAGSFQETAYLEGATLTREDSKEPIPINLRKLFYEGDMSQNLKLEDGDTIYIPEDVTNKYYVLGEVARPGMYRLKENLTVVEAVSNAGGPTERGSLKSTYIIRGNLDNPERIKIDMSKLLKNADITQNVKLQPGDVVYIPESSKPDWNKIASVVSAIVNSSYLLRIWGL